MGIWKCALDKMMLERYKGKKVLVTGHTGFKGGWLTETLLLLGADVVGVALPPKSEPCLFSLLGLESKIHNYFCDIRDFEALKKIFTFEKPEIVLHLAAQPIVLASYRDPRGTFDTNIMGTVNVLECARLTPSVRSLINVTTDKVYENDESGRPFVESDRLNGRDPYSNSKSCSELITASYRNSFFSSSSLRVCCMRAGNVIGGGDFSADRLVPDLFRAVIGHTLFVLRNPTSIRPYQFVMEPVFAYLFVALAQLAKNTEGAYNIGPNASDCKNSEYICNYFSQKWPTLKVVKPDAKQVGVSPAEAKTLLLNCESIYQDFGIRPRLTVDSALAWTNEWLQDYLNFHSTKNVVDDQIHRYLELANEC